MSQDNPPKIPIEAPTSELKLGGAAVVPWLLLILLIAGISTMVLTGRWPLPTNPGPEVDRATFLRELAERNVEFGKTLDDAREHANWDLFANQLDRCTESITKHEQTIGLIRDQLKRLQTGELGYRIAGTPELLDEYAAFVEEFSATAPVDEDFIAAKKAIETYRAQCDKARADRTIVIKYDDKVDAHLYQFRENVQQVARESQDAWTVLQMLTGKASKAPRSEIPLDKAYAVRKEERRRERFKKHTDQLEAERRAADERIQKAELAAQRELVAAEERLRVSAAEAQSERVKAIVQELQTRLAAEKSREARMARFDAEFSKIKPLLSPFISSGRMHLDQKQKWTKGDLAPLSLSAMKAHPSFSNRALGADREWGIFFSAERSGNDRPRGSFPDKIYNNYDVFTRVHKFIAEFGDVLVEKGLLRP